MDCATVIDEKRFTDLMEMWREWHERDRLVEGYAEESTVLASNTSKLFEELCEDVDTWVCEVIESEVNDLPPNERIAVHHVCLRTPFRPAGPLWTVYGKARDRLVERLEARGIQ